MSCLPIGGAYALILTSRLKMRYGTRIKVNYSGDHPQTIVFPLDDVDLLGSNVALLRQLFGDYRFRRIAGGGILAQGIQPDQVVNFVRRFNYAPKTRTISSDHLSAWMESKVQEGLLTDWSVYIDGKSEGANRSFEFAGYSIGMPSRSRIPQSNSIGTLVDPRHEGVDLPGGPEPFRRADGTYDSASMRSAREGTNGLLIVYPIDPDSTAGRAGSNRTALFSQGDSKPESVVGFCLSFPFIGLQEGTDYVVGRKWA